MIGQVEDKTGVLARAGTCLADALTKAGRDPRPIPQALESVHAGFPSVAQDYFNGDFSFDENVIVHPDSTFIIHVAGDSMTGAGIFDGDLLVVDRSLEPHEGDIVVAILDDEMLVKRLVCRRGRAILHAENPAYPDFTPGDGEDLVIWGVVTGNYHWQRPQTAPRKGGRPLPHVIYPGQHPPAQSDGQAGARGGPGRTMQPTGKASFGSVYPSAEWGHHD